MLHVHEPEVEVMWSASIRYMATHDRHAYVRTHVHCTVCCYSTGSICHSFLLHPEGWRSWMARPWSTIHMTQSPLWHQVRRMWWVGGAPESAESDQGGSPGDRICNKHWNTYWLNYSSIINEWFDHYINTDKEAHIKCNVLTYLQLHVHSTQRNMNKWKIAQNWTSDSWKWAKAWTVTNNTIMCYSKCSYNCNYTSTSPCIMWHVRIATTLSPENTSHIHPQFFLLC